jgi:DNA polymerase-3 subunit alpha
MCFGTFIDFWGNFFESVHFPLTIRRFPFLGRGIYEINGKVTEEFGYYSLEVIRSKKLNYTGDPRYAEE